MSDEDREILQNWQLNYLQDCVKHSLPFHLDASECQGLLDALAHRAGDAEEIARLREELAQCKRDIDSMNEFSGRVENGN